MQSPPELLLILNNIAWEMINHKKKGNIPFNENVKCRKHMAW